MLPRIFSNLYASVYPFNLVTRLKDKGIFLLKPSGIISLPLNPKLGIFQLTQRLAGLLHPAVEEYSRGYREKRSWRYCRGSERRLKGRVYDGVAAVNKKRVSFLDLGSPLQGYQAARSRSVDDLPCQGRQKSINVNRREIETFRGRIGRALLSVRHDRSGLDN